MFEVLTTYLRVVKFKMGKFEVLKHLDVCVPDQEVSVLLSPAPLKRPVLTTLHTPTLHHPASQRIFLISSSVHQGYVITLTTTSVHAHPLYISNTPEKNLRFSPGGHDNDKYHLFPHHAPEVTKSFRQRT